MNWLFWQMGSAPFLGGGFGHFYAYRRTLEYPISARMDVKRQLDSSIGSGRAALPRRRSHYTIATSRLALVGAL